MADDPTTEVGKQVGGNNGRRLDAAKSGINIDTKVLGKLKTELDKITTSTKNLKKEMKSLADEAERAAGAITSASSGGGKGYSTGTPRPAGTGATSFAPPTGAPAAAPGGGAGGMPIPIPGMGGGGGGGAAGKAGMAGQVMAAISPIVSQYMGALDTRIDRGIEYATSMDRLNLLTQQMTGMTQMEVIRSRAPMRDYKLGAGGINEMMMFQTQTGYQATGQLARSVESLRAMSGYGKTTQDILQEQRSLMDPNVANQMLFMMGTNAYTTGGGMKDPVQFRREAIARLGLTNPGIAETALMPGSMTRGLMGQMGFDEEFQTSLIQQAQMQSEFEKKGGKGYYDPTNEAHLRKMGINPGSQLAIQQEETVRVEQVREEKFAERQIDNMAALERTNQKLIEALTSLEETMSGLIGQRISGRTWQKGVSSLMSGVGGGLLASGHPIAMGVGGALMLGGALFGDGDTGESSSPSSPPTPPSTPSSSTSSAKDNIIKVPFGYPGDKRITLNELKSKSTFNKLHPTMQERLLQMMRANPNVGIGQGIRSTAEQETMFYERYKQVKESEGYDVQWNGTYWKHVSGPAAAPPGRSMHEIGLAADLVGDLNWANANASKFGLKHFANVNNEPWHFQPAELPNSRTKYEEAGAPWGTDGGFVPPPLGPDGEITEPEFLGDNGASPGEVMQGFSMSSDAAALSGFNYNIEEKILANLKTGASKVGRSNYASTRTSGKTKSGTTPTGSLLNGPVGTAGAGAKLAAEAAYRANFREEDLFTAVAIAGRESNWTNVKSSKSDDWGMWQINGINKAVFEGLGYKKEELLDPYKNASVAFALFSRSGWSPWKASDNSSHPDVQRATGGRGFDPNGDHMWNTESKQAEARAAVAPYLQGSSASGDAVFSATPSKLEMAASSGGKGRSSSQTMHLSSSPTITIAPVINFNGSPSSPDLRNIAKTVARMLQEEIEMTKLRSA